MRRVCLVQILAITVTQWPQMNMGVYSMAKTYIARCDILFALFPCVDLDRYRTVFPCDTSMATK
jgi:hypothetical protein